MTEAEWLACTDPGPMLEFFGGKASDRKLRLYLCAGCRHISHLFFRPWSFTAVEVAERFADGQATQEDLHRAEYDAEAATFGYELDDQHWPYSEPYRMEVVPRLVEIGALPKSALSGGEWRVDDATRQKLLGAAWLADCCASFSVPSSKRWLSSISQVDWPGRWLLDCLFPNPFRPIALDPAWLTPQVKTLAQQIYNERAFERMPELADALAEAGSTNPDILSHCRGPGPHVRGCWVVDLVLGKE